MKQKVFVLVETEKDTPEFAHTEVYLSVDDARNEMRDRYDELIDQADDGVEDHCLCDNHGYVVTADCEVYWRINECTIK